MCAPIPKGKWAWKYDKCINCSTKKIKHKGRGLCLHCWDKERDKKPRRQIIKKQSHDRWYYKVKGTPEYINYVNETAKK